MTLKSAIKSKNIKEIRKISSKITVAEIVNIIQQMSGNERLFYFRVLNSESQSQIFSSLDFQYQEQLIKSFTDEQIKTFVNDLYTDDLADLLEEVPEEIAKRMLSAASKETRDDVNKILRYQDDQVGSIMNVDILTIKQSWNVGDAIDEIKKKRKEIRTSHYFFVVNNKNQLVGAVRLEDLMFAKNSKKVKDIIIPTGFVQTTTDKEKAGIIFAEYDMSSLPVVNSAKMVIGMITSDDMIDVVQESATEDFRKMAGIQHDVDKRYSKSKILSLFRSRIVWLLLLMISATISQIVLDQFQEISANTLGGSGAISTAGIWTTALVAILPVISGAAGNAGSQSSTMIIRALAVGDITVKDYLRVIWKELRIAFFVGMALGISNFVRLIIYYSATGDIGSASTFTKQYIFLSLAASIALFAVIILAKVVGGALPLIAKKLKLDPAVMAAPLLTTLIDALSTMIFFGISIGIMFMVI